MPKGEWVSINDIKLNSLSDDEENLFEKGSRFTLLDTDGKYVSLALNGTEKLVIIRIEDFHENFNPHWRRSDKMIFENHNPVSLPN